MLIMIGHCRFNWFKFETLVTNKTPKDTPCNPHGPTTKHLGSVLIGFLRGASLPKVWLKQGCTYCSWHVMDGGYWGLSNRQGCFIKRFGFNQGRPALRTLWLSPTVRTSCWWGDEVHHHSAPTHFVPLCVLPAGQLFLALMLQHGTT